IMGPTLPRDSFSANRRQSPSGNRGTPCPPTICWRPIAGTRHLFHDCCPMSFLYIIPWVLTSVLIGVYLGYTLGKGHAPAKAEEASETERAKIMRAVIAMLDSAERLAGDVGSHNTELLEVGREVV